MLCLNCNNELNGNEDFCPNCGMKINKIDSNVSALSDPTEKRTITTTEQYSNNIKQMNSTLSNNIKKNKKIIFVILGIIFSLGIIFGMYGILFGFKKLSWDKKYEVINLEYVTQNNVDLGVIFNGRSDKIKYKVTCGKINNNNGYEIEWDLTNSLGNCKAVASYKLRRIVKNIIVINSDTNKKALGLNYEIDMNSDEDIDLDGLTNKEEKKYKTKADNIDTDMDGLDDKYEIFDSKTDPNKKDTDNDGLSDYDEKELGLNPLTEFSKNDRIKDGERTLTYNYSNDNIKLDITGTGNIASLVAEANSNTKISGKKGMIDKLYTLYTEGNINEAVITIKYTNEELTKFGLNEDTLSIYYYNEKESKYEKVDTTIDKKNKTLTSTLKHFSNYVVGDTSLVKETTTTQVLFVLDNSWSMYTNEQYKKITGKEYYGGLFGSSKLDGFDANGVRFTLTSDLITRLAKKDFQIGLSEFRRDYENALEIGSDVKKLKSKLETMNGKFITNTEGTDISNALTNSISEFTKESDNKYIVILTDGQDSSLKYNTKKIIETATENDVKVCSVGFGGGSYNVELSNISNGTGCKFYSSTDVSGLSELFENIGSELDDDLVDVDGDNVADGILLADSGFVVNRDGFSFGNYGTNYSKGGHCYGMATIAELYYKKILPFKLKSKTVDSKKSNPYDLNGTYFESYDNLYNYKLQTNVLKYTFGFNLFNENKPLDLKTVDKNKLIYNEKFKKEIIDSGIYDFVEEETSLSKKEQLEKWGANYEKADAQYLNEDKMQKSKVMKNDDLQILNAIYTAFIKQDDEVHYSSGSNLVLWLRNVLGTEPIEYTGENGFINILKTRLSNEDPLVMSATYSDGLHAINAISLVQDIENPNYYYIGVYDNNYPGEKRYVDIKCNEKVCLMVANDYYTNTDEPIRITPSLEYDLNYFK